MRVIQTLRKCEVFAALDDSELEKLASLAAEKEYAAGATIFQEGGTAEECFVVEVGKVALQMALPAAAGQPSRRVTVDVINSGEMIGWSSIVGPYVYTFTAVCLQKTRVLSVNAVNLRIWLANDTPISHKITRGLVRVIADRLDVTRRVLVSERLLTIEPGRAG